MLTPVPNPTSVLESECTFADTSRHRVCLGEGFCHVSVLGQTAASRGEIKVASNPGMLLLIVPLHGGGIVDAWHDRCPAPILPATRSGLHVFDLRYNWSIMPHTSFEAFAIEMPCRLLATADIGDRASLHATTSAARRGDTHAILVNLCSAAAHLIELDCNGHAPIVRNLVEAVISNIQLGLCECCVHPRPSRDRLAAWQEQRIRNYIAANLTEKIRVSDVSRSCGISCSHFSRLFKNTIGVTLHQWVIEQRIEAAKRLLCETTAAISEIASATGFADQAHFSRVFSKTTNATPMVWRRHKRA